MAMFEVNTATGNSNSEFNNRRNEILMEMRFPHFNNGSLLYQKSEIDMSQNTIFPTNGFTLNLALRYDNNFANRFGPTPENTYVSNSF